MSPADLDAMMEGVTALLENVTPGPWRLGSWGDNVFGTGPNDEWLLICRIKRDDAPVNESRDGADARFIAASRELVPALAAEVRAQRETIAGLEARVEALTRAAQAIQENANGSFEMDDGERGYLVHSDDMDRLKNVVSRKRSVSVPRCTAETTARLYSQPHQCPYAAVVQIDGDWLCQKHADLWAQAEGRAALSGETPND